MLPSTAINVHVNCLFLCLTCTLQIHNCVLLDLVHVCNMMCLHLVLLYWSFVVLENGSLNMSMSIRLPSLPVSILHAILYLLYSLFVSRFVTIIDLMLLKLNDLMVNKSFFCSFSAACIGVPVILPVHTSVLTSKVIHLFVFSTCFA